MALDPIRFTLDVEPQAVARRLQVRLEVGWPDSEPPEGFLDLFSPVWTPGSYLVREYARHFSRFEAADSAGKSLAWTKTRKNRYRIQVPPGTEGINICYTVYTHELSVRTAHVSGDHAMWNGACLLLWPLDQGSKQPQDRTAEIRVKLPRGWQLHSQLPARSDTETGDIVLHAASLDELVDSPCLAGNLITRQFDALGVPHSLVLDGLCGVEPPDSLANDTRNVVEAAARVFSPDATEPALPYDRYLFLCMFADRGRGGLEHRSSSLLLAPRTTFGARKSYQDFMGLIAHEHFHVWNAKRMRPADLWQYDYENENYTQLLWVAEGFTAYYDDHLCLRAGVLMSSEYLKIIADHIAAMRRSPGRLDQPLADASFDAWIRLYRPDENTRNVTQSYYGNGALVAMLLDLKIRELTRGAHSLDDAMRTLYRSTYLEERGFAESDVVACLSQAAGHDLSEMVHRMVHGPLDPDFEAAFAPFGLELVEKADGDHPNPNDDRENTWASGCYLGLQFVSASATVASIILGSPADLAGLAPGDELLALNGLRVNLTNWSEVFGTVARRDEPLTVLVSRRGHVQEIQVLPESQPPGEVEIRPCQDSTPQQDGLRQGWLFEGQGAT